MLAYRIILPTVGCWPRAGVAPRVAMALMRHTDMRLTMNVYTDPHIFNLAGAVEKLPSLPTDDTQTQTVKATDGGFDRCRWARRKRQWSTGWNRRLFGRHWRKGATSQWSLTLVTGENRQQKTPSGRDGAKERVKGVEPSTFTLAT